MARISICTLGCKVNQYEAEMAAQQARAAGHEIVEFGEPADIQIVHTCSITKAAVRDGRQALRHAQHLNPQSTVIATGCAARTDAEDLLPSPDVTLVEDLAQAVALEAEGIVPIPAPGVAAVISEIEQAGRQRRTRALLKIHDGCYFRCSFCIVPNARPVESSKPLDEALEEARTYVAQGHKEIVLTGVRITGYRPEKYLRRGLVELIKRLGDIDGLLRVRLTSLYPSEVGTELLAAMASTANACPHLHLALQSGDDDVLRRMKRHYTSAKFEEVVLQARELLPDVAITTDVISGFPGETEEAFENTRALMERVAFSRGHCFTYSPRKGTPGAEMPGQVPVEIARERTRELIRLTSSTGRQYRFKYVGTIQKVIVEQQKGSGELSGLTDRYVEVLFSGDAALRGELVDVRITGLTSAGLKGELAGDRVSQS